MKIGLTYDLRDDYLKEGLTEEETLEMDSVTTIEALVNTIAELGYEVIKIGNVKSLIKKLAYGERWDLIFNIAEGVYGMGREAQVPAILDAYQIPYTFSDTIVMAVALQKAMTKRIASDLGVLTADFYSVRTEEDILKVNLSYPLFAKPVAEGTGRGISDRSIIYDKKQLEEVCVELLHKYHQPVLVETYLPGREFTVGILGTGHNSEAIGTIEIIIKPQYDIEVYGFKAKEFCEELIEYRPITGIIAEKAKKMALTVHKGINCRDASRVDIKEDEHGNLHFLEINPLAGLHPTHSDLPTICSFFDISYKELIKRILFSAQQRIRPKQADIIVEEKFA
jgi:D-alanine-D-alanine ligase